MEFGLYATTFFARSRDKQIVAGRGLYGSAASEQFSEGGDGGSLETADRSFAVGPGRAPLNVQPGGGSSFTQSNLSCDADQQFVHAMIKQSRYLDELAVSPRRHVLTVCLFTVA